MRETLLIASFNRGKIREIQEFLAAQAIECVGLESLPEITPWPESGRSFKENALQKAIYYSQASSLLLTLADDSGLVVDALGGAPGIYSARFVSERASDEQRYQAVLAQLGNVPAEKRTARFICVIALAHQGREVAIFEGRVEGQIAFSPSGNNGFGYDPIFYIPEAGKSMAELSLDEKQSISHRGRALRSMREAMLQPSFLPILSP